MAKSLTGWNTVQALRTDEGEQQEAVALFQHAEERREEENKVKAMLGQQLVKTFFNQMEAHDIKREKEIEESGMLTKGTNVAGFEDIKLFERVPVSNVSDALGFGGQFRKTKERVQLTGEFQDALKDDAFRQSFMADPANQRFLSRMHSQGYYDFSTLPASAAGTMQLNVAANSNQATHNTNKKQGAQRKRPFKKFIDRIFDKVQSQ